MKITNKQLKQIIKEELDKLLNEGEYFKDPISKDDFFDQTHYNVGMGRPFTDADSPNTEAIVKKVLEGIFSGKIQPDEPVIKKRIEEIFNDAGPVKFTGYQELEKVATVEDVLKRVMDELKDSNFVNAAARHSYLQ